MRFNIFRRKKKTEPIKPEAIQPEEINEIETETTAEDVAITEQMYIANTKRQLLSDALNGLPVFTRLTYARIAINNAIVEGKTEADINWDYINTICTTDLDVFDYNLYRACESIEELEGQRFNVIAASSGVGAWQKHICKDCGSAFYMTYNEVQFFREKELHLPKRCKICREKRKEGNASE